MTDDTLDLARRAAAGDGAALEVLLERHLPGLRAYVRGRMGAELRARESVSDVVQSTCREILEGAGNFVHPGASAFRRWLFTTAARKVCSRLEHHRALKRGATPALRIGVSSGMTESRLVDCYRRFSRPGDGLELRDELERIESALDRLSEEQREVVLLAHAAELPRAEIASKLGKPEATVRSILHRALARLALELGAEEGA